MGKNKALVILGIGVLIALVASLFTYGWLQNKGRVQAQTLETISVVVASSDLSWGTDADHGHGEVGALSQAEPARRPLRQYQPKWQGER